MQPDQILDAGETGCGELTMLIFQTIKQIEPGQTLEVRAYDLAAAMDIPAWCRSTGNMLVTVDANSHPKRFLIRSGASNRTLTTLL